MKEEDFLMSLKSGLVPCPEDIDQVLILADWLDEDGQCEKADWIRQQVKEGGIPHFDPEIQPDLFFRRGTTWKVFRTGRPGNIKVGIYDLEKFYQYALPWHQKRILRGLIIALHDQGRADEAWFFQVWIEDATGFFVNEFGHVSLDVNGPDFVGWNHEGPYYYEGHLVQSSLPEYLEFRRHPGN